ncbi:hypothetical protein OESDEN_22763 [Oesophagostomum dentatum]|uniref:MULE transposase domain-containing protein n=1 Tax=Oesophagostomum dentatum TaxID=61180 RepID=A0A0B1S2D2_OESDE|nr:hypothetical protein OESDEN_22763 [Oesophagostomum dentatum]
MVSTRFFRRHLETTHNYIQFMVFVMAQLRQALTSYRSLNPSIDQFRRIFCALKDELTALGAGSGLRIVLDYEKAAIAAAENIFSESKVEGCGWHLSQAWTRKRNSLGLRQFIVGKKRCRNIARWWNTVKGIPFLPEDLVRRVPAIYHPPVPESHTAYMKCLEFISYLHTVWLDGPFKGLWCKWKVEEVRTTNLAEAFHRSPQKVDRYDAETEKDASRIDPQFLGCKSNSSILLPHASFVFILSFSSLSWASRGLSSVESSILLDSERLRMNRTSG